MSGGFYRPRPDNGSGDSPRPPFLTEFVNQVGKCDLVNLIYHLFGGQLGLWIYSHVEWSFRLKAEASRCVVELQAAYAYVSQKSVDGLWSLALSPITKAFVPEFNAWPVCRPRDAGAT